MSYARFGWDDSDVYVYADPDGHITCCACRFNGEAKSDESALLGVRFPPSWRTESHGLTYGEPGWDDPMPPVVYGEVIAHLSEHVDAGHTVPEDAFLRLIQEQGEAIRFHGSGSEENQ